LEQGRVARRYKLEGETIQRKKTRLFLLLTRTKQQRPRRVTSDADQRRSGYSAVFPRRRGARGHEATSSAATTHRSPGRPRGRAPLTCSCWRGGAHPAVKPPELHRFLVEPLAPRQGAPGSVPRNSTHDESQSVRALIGAPYGRRVPAARGVARAGDRAFASSVAAASTPAGASPG